MHLEGVPGPDSLHSYALASGAFLVGLRAISHLAQNWCRVIWSVFVRLECGQFLCLVRASLL